MKDTTRSSIRKVLKIAIPTALMLTLASLGCAIVLSVRSREISDKIHREPDLPEQEKHQLLKEIKLKDNLAKGFAYSGGAMGVASYAAFNIADRICKNDEDKVQEQDKSK